MPEKVTTIYESPHDDQAKEFFAEFGHVALANIYEPTLGADAAKYAYQRTRLHTNNRINGQTGDIWYSMGQLSNPIARVITAAIQNAELLEAQDIFLRENKVRAQVIDHAPGAQGAWHKDFGMIVTTLQGSSQFEIDGEGKTIDANYHVTPGTIVVMDPSRKLLHRGIAGANVSRTGLAIEQAR